MHVFKILFWGSCLTFFLACSSTKNQKTKIETAINAQADLDWPGTYFGILPCPDCDGIETELSIRKDGTFMMSKKRLGRDIILDTLEGSFLWNENNSSISLGILIPGFAPSLYAVKENQLVLLDENNQEMKGPKGETVRLVKTGNPSLEDKRWQLVELFGKNIQGTPESDFLVLHSKDLKIIARAHCNMLQFTYKIRFENQIQVMPGPATKMACPDSAEDELIRALSSSDKIYRQNDYLLFQRGQVVLAKFSFAP